jgi:hypothetical protein
MLTKIIIPVVSFLIAVGAAYVAVDERYAHAADMQRLEQRLDQKILEDRSIAIQERIWKVEDRVQTQRRPTPELLDSIRRLNAEKALVDQKLKALEDKKAVK